MIRSCTLQSPASYTGEPRWLRRTFTSMHNRSSFDVLGGEVIEEAPGYGAQIGYAGPWRFDCLTNQTIILTIRSVP